MSSLGGIGDGSIALTKLGCAMAVTAAAGVIAVIATIAGLVMKALS
jgi:hypothetical protein